MMKESKTNLVQQKVLSDYEKKRIERLKQNVNFMAAKGCSSLASKIFQEKLQFASVRQEELNDEDQDNTLEEEGDEAGSNVGSEAGGSNANNAKEQSKKNKANREILDDMHTLGPKSYARLRYELQQDDPEHKEPSQAKVYIESRKRNPKRKYKTSFATTKDNIAQMEALAAKTCEGSSYRDPYYDVITKPEHSGRRRLYGQGVTKTTLKNKGKKSDFILPQEFVQSMQKDFIGQLQEANPGMNFVIPEGFGGQSSTSKHIENQVQDQANIVLHDGACAQVQPREE